MTPIEKAYELYEKMEVDVNDYTSNYPSYCQRQAKECALIAVNEILNENQLYDDFKIELTSELVKRYKYWEQVKIEIEKIIIQ